MIRKVGYFLLVIFFIGLVLVPFFLPVEEIECRTDSESCSQEVTLKLRGWEGKSYFKATKEIGLWLKENNSIVSFETTFVLPKKMLVKLTMKKPAYVLKDVASGDFYFLNSTGEIFLKKNTAFGNLFVEAKMDNPKEGQKIPEETLELVKAFSYLSYLYKIENARLFTDRLEVKFEDKPLLILPEGKDSQLLVGSARLLLEELEKSPSQFGLDKPLKSITIDLRYKNAVIR